eukprot:TRINITY_DN11595_c1_g1_i2.p1 TRINITY_DN11595_c1_g1~~TRINITY_DN11595_c1_g1_i2.p1  ORF type:complete len:185 (-),score=-20.19 TRINITY_DN11595_c1_g1_i2:134-688(-)
MIMKHYQKKRVLLEYFQTNQMLQGKNIQKNYSQIIVIFELPLMLQFKLCRLDCNLFNFIFCRFIGLILLNNYLRRKSKLYKISSLYNFMFYHVFLFIWLSNLLKKIKVGLIVHLFVSTIYYYYYYYYCYIFFYYFSEKIYYYFFYSQFFIKCTHRLNDSQKSNIVCWIVLFQYYLLVLLKKSFE